jgi:hypothetical protein
VQTTPDGVWLAAVVSDGAGSAARAAEGSRLVATSVVEALITKGPQVSKFGGGWLKDRIQAALIDVRQDLRDRGPLADFHCTLVGVLIGPPGGVFIHIGDGAALASKVAPARDEAGKDDCGITLWNELTVSPPENGSYSNETFFVTEDDWDKHLRKTILPGEADLIVLMSDGAMPFVLQQDRPFCPFVEPLIGELLRVQNQEARDALLEDYLSQPENDAVTDDDKTLVVIARRSLTRYSAARIVPSSFPEVPPGAGPLAQRTKDAPTPRRPSTDERAMNKAMDHTHGRSWRGLLCGAAFVLALLSFAISCFALYSGRKIFFGTDVATVTNSSSASTTKGAEPGNGPLRDERSQQKPPNPPAVMAEPKPAPDGE